MGTITLEERKDNEEVYESLWEDQAPLKIDWGKRLCPEHKVACKAQMCTVMAALERREKREQENKRAGEDNGNWNTVRRGKPRGRKFYFHRKYMPSSFISTLGGRGNANAARGGNAWGRGRARGGRGW